MSEGLSEGPHRNQPGPLSHINGSHPERHFRADVALPEGRVPPSAPRPHIS
jgi:hypothetical protein